MKKILNISVLLAAVAVAASCDLDLVPRGSIVYDPDNLITNESDMSGYEAGIVATLRGLDYGNYDMTSDIMMDEFNAQSDYGNNYGDVHRSDFTPSGGTNGSYSGPYGAINTFNIAIEGMKKVPSDFTERAAIARGEAYFGRAQAYLYMARCYAKPYGSSSESDLCVPLVTKYDQLARPARATVKEIYDQIKADLDSAAILLAGVSGEVRAQRPTIDAVQALYARYYLDIKDYDNAAASALKVINTGNYKLAETVDDMINECINDEGTEPIIQYYASLQEGIGSHGAYCGGSKDDERGIYYAPYFIPTEKLIEAYDTSDFRYKAWFDNESIVYLNKTWFENGEITVFKKYRGNPALRTSDVPNSANAIKPFMISEMYLIAAEAYAQSGNTASAKEYLNILQNARNAEETDGTMDNIKNEWYKETCGEGLRFSCLKRWGEGFSGRDPQPAAINVVMTGSLYTEKELPADDYHWQWPIPTWDMQTNLNLVQNEGYVDEE